MSVEHPEVEQTWRLERWLKTYEPYPCFETDVARLKLELNRRGELTLGRDQRTELTRLIGADIERRANAFINGAA